MNQSLAPRSITLAARLACAAALAIAALLLSHADVHAQEFLDTAGRWKQLSLPPVNGVVPRAMIAHNGRVLIGRNLRSIIVSRDSGETWIDAGSTLPAEITTVWALAFVDTIGAPNHILGISTTSGAPVRVRTIESTDGGLTWRGGIALPELDVLFTVDLDTMRLYGPPQMLFVANASGIGRTGFIYSAAGLFATTDNGATWTRRGRAVAIRALSMANEQVGIAALGEHQPNTTLSSQPGGLWWTSDGGATWTQSYTFSDGGFYQYITLRAFSSTSFRAFVPERFQNYLDWRLLRSTNGGRTWDEHRGRQARRPLYGLAVLRDTTDVHVVSDGAILQHSGNGGELFYLLRDTTVTPWWQTPLDDIPGYVTKAPVAAYDRQYLYFTVFNTAARWRMASVEPRSGVDVEGRLAAQIMVAPNPTNGAARLRIESRLTDVDELLIVDALGEVRCRLRVDDDGFAELSPGMLPQGRYVAVARTRHAVLHNAFVISY